VAPGVTADHCDPSVGELLEPRAEKVSGALTGVKVLAVISQTRASSPHPAHPT